MIRISKRETYISMLEKSGIEEAFTNEILMEVLRNLD